MGAVRRLSVFEEIFEDGRQAGRQEVLGLVRGQLLRTLRTRFGDLPPDLSNRLHDLSLEQLTPLVDAAWEAPSLAAFRAGLPRDPAQPFPASQVAAWTIEDGEPSDLYRTMIEKGWRDGKADESYLELLRQVLPVTLRFRFGPLPPSFPSNFQGLTLEQLAYLVDAAWTDDSLDIFQARLPE
jgi:hypothetical protein